jgi:hypothetical protein
VVIFFRPAQWSSSSDRPSGHLLQAGPATISFRPAVPFKPSLRDRPVEKGLDGSYRAFSIKTLSGFYGRLRTNLHESRDQVRIPLELHISRLLPAHHGGISLRILIQGGVSLLTGVYI